MVVSLSGYERLSSKPLSHSKLRIPVFLALAGRQASVCGHTAELTSNKIGSSIFHLPEPFCSNQLELADLLHVDLIKSIYLHRFCIIHDRRKRLLDEIVCFLDILMPTAQTDPDLLPLTILFFSTAVLTLLTVRFLFRSSQTHTLNANMLSSYNFDRQKEPDISKISHLPLFPRILYLHSSPFIRL